MIGPANNPLFSIYLTVINIMMGLPYIENIILHNVSTSAGVQRVPERLQDLYKYGVRGERRHVHVPPEDEADGGTDPLVVVADPVGVLVHARRGRGAQGPEVREHTAD